MLATFVRFATLYAIGHLPFSASLVGHQSDHRLLEGTIVVLRTNGRPSKFVLEDLMQRYQDQLHKYGIEFSVLHDKGNGPVTVGNAHDLLQLSEKNKDGLAQFFHLEKSQNGKERTKVQLCSVSWDQSQKEFMHLDDSLFTARTCHDQNIAMWWKHCSHDFRTDLKYVWFLESDAFFNGNIVNFFRDFEHNDADLVASGFRVAGKHWWKYKTGLFDRGMNQGLKIINHSSDVVSNVKPLPGMTEGPKNCWFSGHNDRQGLLFFQDHVMRLSKDLLEALSTNMYKHGVLGASEAFISTMCASGLDFRDDRSCKIHDFAPMLERKNGETWVTPIYCFGENSHYDPRTKYHCTQKSWQNRWIHAVKVKAPGAMQCDNTVESSADDGTISDNNDKDDGTNSDNIDADDATNSDT